MPTREVTLKPSTIETIDFAIYELINEGFDDCDTDDSEDSEPDTEEEDPDYDTESDMEETDDDFEIINSDENELEIDENNY